MRRKLGFRYFNRSAFGFTLAELLIALAILGVIATFTIPKVLQSQQDGKYKAIAKETAAMLSEVYNTYRLQNTPTASTGPTNLTPYMNYVNLRTTGSIDDVQTQATASCTSGNPCITFHNGSAISLWTGSFNGTASTNGIFFTVDPDGKVTDGTTNGPGKSVRFYLYFDGRISSYSTLRVGTTCSAGADYADPTLDPPWFGWN